MNITRSAVPGATRGPKTTIALALAVSLVALLPAGLLAQDAEEAEEPSIAPAEAACESADDLSLIVEFLEDIDVDEDGWIPVLVGGIAGLSEGRTLVGLVAETFQPLVNDVVVSFQNVMVTVEELGDMETTGAQLAAIGEAITDIGTAMDTLSIQLQAPCPSD